MPSSTKSLTIAALQEYAYRRCTFDGSDQLEIFNPATNDCIGILPTIAPESLNHLCTQTENAFKEWSQTTPFERSTRLHTLANNMEQNLEQLATIISLENGKPFAESRGEVSYSIGFFRWFANSIVRLEGSIPASTSALKIEIHHRPVGVCAAITPWNFPLAMLAKKCAAALAAGCGMLCKPAEETPFSAIALMRIIEDSGFPVGLVQVILGNPQAIGKYFCTNPTIRKLSFTGSTEVGRLLMAQSAPNLQKLSMELGGNAPFIVLESADLNLVCSGMLRSKFRNSGQACISANRFIIVESRYNEVLDMLTKQAEQLIVGSAFENHAATEADIGPLISLKAVKKLHRLLHDALEKGAKLRSGTLPDITTQFVHPIVITDITPDMDLWWEELFGPVIACASAKNTNEAIQLANHSRHGLGAYIFTQNPVEIEKSPAQIECGMVGVNTGAISMPNTPFGGVKYSGFGREGGVDGLFEYLTTQTIVRQF
jgi:succinate-semialdehyde dehydrogenase/glutarate-semialdehyde dehydrogenase